MSTFAFEITDLVCSYSGEIEDRVLEIESLKLAKGKLIFLLGASGSGKSTLLEILGLMNNPVAKGNIRFQPHKEESIDLVKLWDSNNKDALYEIRKKHFSFIFQNTNLMENFTAFENVSISQMIKEEISQSATMEGVYPLLADTNLSPSDVDEVTFPGHLSVGQRQRLAFIRAINTDFSIIFGDEPTGNLDETNANELIGILKKSLDEQRTAIIVSHDIDLALKHADQIIVISKSPETGIGQINQESIYERSYWEPPAAQTKFKNMLARVYKQGSIVSDERPNKETFTDERHSIEEKGQLNGWDNREIDTKLFSPSYRSLFLKKEGKALAGGLGKTNLWILVAILSLTLISIGFGNGGLRYLNIAMNNAFVKWLSINIPSRQVTEIQKLKGELIKGERPSDFGYSNVTGFVEYSLPFFYHGDSANYVRVNGRSLDLRNGPNPLVDAILGNDNLIRGDHSINGDDDLSLIVTERFLNLMGYPENSAFVNMQLWVFDSTLQEGGKDLVVPVPIRAIVREIPGYSSVAYTLGFYETIKQKNKSSFNTMLHSGIRMLVPGDSLRGVQTLEALKKLIAKDAILSKLDPAFHHIPNHTSSYQEATEIEILPFPRISGKEAENTWKLIKQKLKDEIGLDARRVFEYEIEYNLLNEINYDKLSVYFEDRSRVRSFAEAMRYEYKNFGISEPVETDMSKVEEKENFDFLSKVTLFSLITILIFGIVSVCVFVSNLLKMHLAKVQMNIGTFKAFGLSDRNAEHFYFLIVLKFLFDGFWRAILIAFVLGLTINFLLVKYLGLDAGIDYFHLLHTNTLLAVFAIAISGVLISRNMIRKMLNNTPGNLIYGR